jgi:two-component system, NarL family, invasion response regulator UvrY
MDDQVPRVGEQRPINLENQDSTVNMKSKPITVAIADDHGLLIEAYSLLLKSQNISVVGGCTDPERATDLFIRLNPNVILLDVRFGDQASGLDIAKNVLAINPNAAIIFLSQFEQLEVIKEAYRIGAMSYLTKDVKSAELLKAITTAAQGEQYFMPAIEARMRDAFFKTPRVGVSPRQVLTERELEVFKLQALGRTLPEIALTLKVSERTVSNDAGSIKSKLPVERQAALTLLALQWGLIDAPTKLPG